MRGSRRALRVAARGATTVALVTAATVVGFSVSSDHGRTVEALGQAVGSGGEYHPLPPKRILDTRDPSQDVAPFGRKAYSDTAVFDVPVVGKGGLPAFSDSNGDCADDNVLSVAVNITVVNPSANGYLEAFGQGENQAPTSILNFKPGDVVANSAILRPGCGGQLSIRLAPGSVGAGDVVIDVFGWFSSSTYGTRGARLEPVNPGRIYDSREAVFGNAPFGTADQRNFGIRGSRAFDTQVEVVPDDANIVGVLVNVTAVNAIPGSQPTFISLLPAPVAPGDVPTTSNLNLRVGQVRSNLAIVPLSADGQLWVYNKAGNVHVILDVMGYLVANRDVNSTRGRVVPLVAPFRAFDTREAQFSDQPLPPANAEDWSFTGFANDVKVQGIPVGPQLGLIGNLTGAALARQYSWAPAASYITAYPTPAAGGAQSPPLISNLGITDTEIVPNMALLRYGADGSVRFYNRGGYLDYLLDVSAVVLA